MKRKRIAIVLMAWTLLACLIGTASAQQQTYSITLMLDYTTSFPPEQWISARVRLRNGSQRDVDGYLALSQTRGGRTVYRTPVIVPANSTATVNMPFQLPGGYVRGDGAAPGQLMAGNIAWFTSGGQRLALDEVAALPIERTNDMPEGIASSVLLQITDKQPGDSDAYDASNVRNALRKAETPAPILQVQLDSARLSRWRVAYSACAAIVLEGTDPESLDVAQRQALLDYVNAGGRLIIAAPTPEENYPASWLGPYLPVQLVGQRYRSSLPLAGDKTLKLIEELPTAEAIAGAGTVLLADSQYVHAATRSVGMGQVMFLSFPIGALNADDKEVQDLWQHWIPMQNATSPVNWGFTSLPASRDAILSQMLGISAPPWMLAAGIVGGYLLIVILMPVIFRGAHQPRAFIVMTGVAVVLAIGLLIAAKMRGSGNQPMAASLATIDVSPEGGGYIQEQAVLVGSNTETSLNAIDSTVAISPVQVSRGPAAEVLVAPAGVPRTTVFGDHYEQVWQATGIMPSGKWVRVTGQFTEKGLKIDVDNQLDQPIQSPLLLIGRRNFSLPDLAHGNTQVLINDANLGGDFVNSSVLTSNIARLRGQVVGAMQPVTAYGLQPVRQPAAMVGFLPESSGPRLISTSLEGVTWRSQTAVRSFFTIQPSEIGKTIHVSGDLVQAIPALGAPINQETQEWSEWRGDGSWLVRLTPPAGTGKLRPTVVSGALNPNIPRQQMTLRRQQVSGGTPTLNPNGEVIGQWAKTGGTQSVQFEVGPQDIDANGDVWLSITVETVVETAPGELPVPWQLMWMKLGMDAEVVGPPVGQ